VSNVGYGTLQIIPSARGFGSALNRETNAPLVAGGKSGGKKFGGAFLGGLKGVAGPLAAILGVKALGGFAKSAINEASDLRESVNAVQVSYGKAAKGVLAIGKNSATSFGLSKSELNAFAVRFSGFSKQIAGPNGDVAKSFESVLGRATDFASVMNLEVGDAANLFQSGLAGETEPLRRFGIDLSAASVQAYAYANGIAKSGAELTEQQKVQARYGSLMAQTKKTQGDFAATSDELANQQRILSARWKNAKGELAKGLLPVATKFVGLLNGGLGPAMTFVSGLFSGGFGGGSGGALGKTMKSVQAFAAPLLATLKSIGKDVMGVVGPAFDSISKIFTSQVLPAFQAFLPAVQPVANFLLKIFGSAIVGVLKGVVLVVKGVLTTLAGVFNIFAGILTGDWGRLWSGIKQVVSGVFSALKGAFLIFWNGSILAVFRRGAAFLLKGIWVKLWTGIKGLATRGMAAAKNVIARVLAAIRGTFTKVLNGIVSFVRGAFARYVNIVRTAFAFARNFITGAWSAIRSVISNAVSGVISRVRSGFSTMVGAVRSKIGEVVSFVKGLPGKAVSALSGIGSKLVQAGRDLIGGFIAGIKEKAAGIAAAVTGPISDGIGKVKGLLKIKSPSRVFMDIGRNVSDGMAIGVTKGSGKVSKAVSALAMTPDLPGGRAGSAAARGGGRGSIVENLTLQSSGNVRDDLDEVLFQIRRLERGGAYA
jgi:hypothetical protein